MLKDLSTQEDTLLLNNTLRRMSSQTPSLERDNTFTGDNEFDGTVTATSFSGDGSGLSGVATNSSTMSWTAPHTFSNTVGVSTFTVTKGSVTVQTGGNEVCIGTGTSGCTTYSIKVETDGDVLFSPAVHTTTCTTPSAGSGTNTAYSSAIAGSTVTLANAGANRVAVTLLGSAAHDTANTSFQCLVIIDGAIPSGYSTTRGHVSSAPGVGTGVQNAGFTYITSALSAGNHTFAFGCWGQTAAGWDFYNVATTPVPQFCATELR